MYKAICLYVDNQEVVKYPVDYISEKLSTFDIIIWFGGDEKQVDILEGINHNSKVVVVNIDHKINAPSDIESGQTKCFKWMQENIEADIYALMEADFVMTEYGNEEVERWAQEETEGAVCFAAMQNKLYHETWNNPVALQIHRKGFSYDATGGSWHRYANGNGVRRKTDYCELAMLNMGKRAILDLGYLSLDAIYRKAQCHSVKLWPDAEWKALEVFYAEDKPEYIRRVIRKYDLKRENFIPLSDQQYWKIFEELNLLNEYEFVQRLI